ncbi:MAG: precorrin-6y C5,15-methyltransferase (decarboxylating) subunit CbiE [Collinsella aerofaciens]
MRKVTIIGAGPGNPDLLSRAALDAIDIADVVIGAHRALAGIDVPPDVVRCELVKTADIVSALTDAASWQRAVVVMTGDVGLFSGARRLVEALSGDAQVDVRVIPGISSASYLAARLARPWQDWRFASAHGVACDIVAEAERAGELFLVTSGGEDPSRLSGELVQAGFGDACVTVAERLSYPDERITCATASEITGQTFDDLNVMLIDFAGGAGSPAGASRAASSRWPYASSGIPDELFIRGDVPMTKQEVRAVALAKLRLTATDTVWDVGAGTGSVSIEAALVARAGSVWAVERNAAGVRLIRENADAFGCGNVHAVPGVAPEALVKLPVPDAVFVGGSAGELPSIVEAALEKNSQVRLCVPCVTVETLTEACALLSGSRFKGFEACQVSAARAEAVGSHHLMKAQNPVFLVSARGAGADAEELAEVEALAESPVGEDPSAEGNPSVEVVSLANCNAAGGEGGAR